MCASVTGNFYSPEKRSCFENRRQEMNKLNRSTFAAAIILSGAVLAGCQSVPTTKLIHATSNAPAAIGPYSQMVQSGDLFYLSGVIPLTMDGRSISGNNVEEQTRVVLEYINATLRSQGMSMGNVLMANVYLVDLNQFSAFNKVYAEYFTSAPPARATVQVSRLPRDVQVEIAVVARK